MILKENYKKLVEQAKEIVMNNFGGDRTRPWGKMHIDSYDDKSYRIETLVWEGSPIKGYIIINHGTGEIKCFGCNDKMLKRFNFKDIENIEV